MEEALVILPAPTPNLQTSRKPQLTMRGHTSFLYTRSLDSIRYLHRITSEIQCLFGNTRQRGDWIMIKVIQQKDVSHEVASLVK